VQIAFSTDAGATFGKPVRVDDGQPIGRVDVLRLGASAFAALSHTRPALFIVAAAAPLHRYSQCLGRGNAPRLCREPGKEGG
jgi:hypothetical protein